MFLLSLDDLKGFDLMVCETGTRQKETLKEFFLWWMEMEVEEHIQRFPLD